MKIVLYFPVWHGLIYCKIWCWATRRNANKQLRTWRRNKNMLIVLYGHYSWTPMIIAYVKLYGLIEIYKDLLEVKLLVIFKECRIVKKKLMTVSKRSIKLDSIRIGKWNFQFPIYLFLVFSEAHTRPLFPVVNEILNFLRTEERKFKNRDAIQLQSHWRINQRYATVLPKIPNSLSLSIKVHPNYAVTGGLDVNGKWCNWWPYCTRFSNDCCKENF